MESNTPQREKRSMIAQNWSVVPWEKMASALRDDYAELTKEYQSKGGIRDRRYQLLQGNYLMFVKLKNDPVELERFKADPYWRGFHQPPKGDNLMLSVLTYNMQSKHDEPIQTLNYKYAKVLRSFDAEGVIPDNVARRLKDGGGIYFIYAQLCKAEKLCWKDSSAEGGDEGDSADNYNQVVAEDERQHVDVEAELIAHEDPELAACEDVEQAAADVGGMLTDTEALSSTPRTSNQEMAAHPEARRAVDDQLDDVKREERPAIPPKQGILNRADLERELIVQMRPEELEQIRDSGGGELIITVMPPDERGFWRVTGCIKRLFPRTDGVAPGGAEEPSAAA